MVMRRDCCWSNTICFLLRLCGGSGSSMARCPKTKEEWRRPDVTWLVQARRNREGGAWGKQPHPDFDRSVIPYSNREWTDYTHQITSHPPPGFSDLPTYLSGLVQLGCSSVWCPKQVTTWFLLSAPEKASRSPVIASHRLARVWRIDESRTKAR